MTCPECLRALDPYLDDQLPVMDTLRVQGHLLCCEPCRKAAESEALLRAAIRADVSADHAPPGLRDRVLQRVSGVVPDRTASGPGRRGRPRRAVPAALAAGLLGALLLIPAARGPADLSPLAAEVVAKHLLYAGSGARGLELATADPSRLAAWLEGRLGFAVSLPLLARPGERLLGGRVTSLADLPAAYLLYEREGHRTSLLVAAGTAPGPARAAREVVEGEEVYTTALGGVALAWWEDGDRLYAAASTAGAGELREFARRCLLSARRAGGAG